MSEQAATPEQRIASFLTPEPPPREEAEISEAPEASYEEAGEYAEAAEAPEASAEPSEEGSAEVTIEEWNQLAEYLGTDPSELYNLTVNLDTPEGPERVTIEQLKDTYKGQLKIQKEAQAIEQARAEIEQQWGQAAAQLQQKEQQAAALLQYVENNFLAEMGSVNWDYLRQTNPAEFAAQRLQFQEKQNQLANLKTQAAMRWDQAQREQVQVRANQERELLGREANLLYSAIPEWRDPQVAANEKREIAQFLLSRGYDPQYVASMANHREVLLARDAMRSAKAKQTAIKNKVFKLGTKTLSPGARGTKGDQAPDTRKLRASLKKSGNYKDAAALISKMI
jgi:hypothetical protein